MGAEGAVHEPEGRQSRAFVEDKFIRTSGNEEVRPFDG
jgi:hypothetical protein